MTTKPKPVVLIHDIDTRLVDEVATVIGTNGLYTTVNTYNESHAMEVVRQYERGFGLLTSGLACIITGWNEHRRPGDQIVYHLRARERRSPLRRPTPVIIITEDHRPDLVQRALDPSQGAVAAYLHREMFHEDLPRILHQVVYEGQAVHRERASS